jgi:predicted phosphodiesterase
MRYAIVSDIHANLNAWQTVLKDIADMRADKLICLGDVTGYGPKPVEVLESVYRVVHVTLLGNHDAAICGKLDPATFSPRAKAAVRRHREQLSETAMAWLKTLPLELATPEFRCAHGDFSDPAAFRYIIEPAEALPSWHVTQEQLLFVGHSHLPAIYVIGASGKPHLVEPCDFQLEEGKRYIINPGSVGYPRVGDCRSSYCVYDDSAKSIVFRQLPFDSENYNQALREAGLGDDAWLQERAKQRALPSLRARLSFAKAHPPGLHAQDVREHLCVGPAHRPRRRLLPLLAFAACAACVAAGVAAFRAGRTLAPPALAVTVPPFDLPSQNAYPLAPDKNLLPELPRTLAPDGRMEGWRYAFEDRTRQTFATGLRDGAITLLFTHDGARKSRLESPLINLAGTRLSALRLRGKAHKSEGFAGTVFFQLVTYEKQSDDALVQLAANSFEVRDARRKAAAPAAALSRKIELSKRVTHVRFRVEADFDGAVELEQPTLTDAANDAAANKKGQP